MLRTSPTKLGEICCSSSRPYVSACSTPYHRTRLTFTQVRGKKNLVIQRSLAGTIGLFVKFSTLQEYGVDRLFFLENHNVDQSQRNIIFLVRGENAKTIRTVAGMPCIAVRLVIPCLPALPMGS